MLKLPRRTALGAAAGLALARPALAQRAGLRIVVGFPPGGSADIVARLIAERLRGFAPTVIVENRPGAAGRLAVEHVKLADPDGSTALLTPSSMLTIAPHLYPRTLRYDPFADFAPITPVGEFPFGVAVGPQAGMVGTLAEFVAWGRGRTDIPFSSAAAGSRPHFLGVQFARANGLSMTHIPYRGSAEALPALFAGDIACSWHPMVDLVSHVGSGRLRIAGVSTPERLARYPQIATFAEQGAPALTSSEWFGVFLPVRTPAPVAEALHAALVAISNSADYAAAVARLEMTPLPLPQAAFAARMRDEFREWGPIIAASGFKPEEG